jgi:hypothetical protein
VQLSRVFHPLSRGSGPKDCRCGHAEHAHEHYRRGTDCALCQCQKFKTGAAAQSQPTQDPGTEPRDARVVRGERADAA